jgi:hypothetical protein
MKEPELEEEALRARARGREIAIERQSLKPAVGPLTLTGPEGEARRLDPTVAGPGLWRVSITAPSLGLYRVSDGDLTALVNVGPDNPREFQDVVSTTERLAPLAAATGGAVLRIGFDDTSEIRLPRIVAMGENAVYGGSDYIGIRRTSASVVTGATVAPLALGLGGLLALLGSLVVAWLVEGRRRRQTAG